MYLKSTVISIIFAMLGLVLQVSTVSAVESPSFPSCVNPQGTVKVNHTSGTHGIVGSNATFSGSDAVYQVSPNTLQQCFCDTSGKGVQTDWWKIAEISDEDLKILKALGWILVPNGALWGLDQSQYLAKNTDYTCQSKVDSANNSNNPSSGGSSGGGAGSVLGASTISSVLGLATTGNNFLYYTLSFFSLAALSLGLILRKRSSK